MSAQNVSGQNVSTQRDEGLLEQIADQALDDDYYVVRDPRSVGSNRTLSAIVLALFGLMIAVAAVQTEVDRPSTIRERAALAADVTTGKVGLSQREATVSALKREVTKLAAAANRTDPAEQELLIRSAGVAVNGEGITVTLVPAASDGGTGDVTFRDLRVMVNGLWALGAEAVSINDSRMATQGYIRAAGGGMSVNFESISPPYVIRAIGKSDDLRDRLAESELGRQWRARAADTGLEYRVRTTDDLRLPTASDQRLSVQVAKQVQPSGDKGDS